MCSKKDVQDLYHHLLACALRQGAGDLEAGIAALQRGEFGETVFRGFSPLPAFYARQLRLFAARVSKPTPSSNPQWLMR